MRTKSNKKDWVWLIEYGHTSEMGASMHARACWMHRACARAEARRLARYYSGHKFRVTKYVRVRG
jgi:hypothetical protein